MLRMTLVAVTCAAALGAPAATLASDGPTLKRGCGTVYLPSIKTTAKLKYVRGKANCKTVRRMAVRWDKGQSLPASWFVGMARQNKENRLFTITWSPKGKVRAELRAFAT